MTRPPSVLGLLAAGVVAVVSCACGSGPPEFQPGIFDSARSVQRHGRITQKSYRTGSVAQTFDYLILEVDGKPVRIPGGYAVETRYCAHPGIDAVAVRVRGKPPAPGIYVLQAVGDEVLFEKVAEYGSLSDWNGPVYPRGEKPWDASRKRGRT